MQVFAHDAMCRSMEQSSTVEPTLVSPESSHPLRRVKCHAFLSHWDQEGSAKHSQDFLILLLYSCFFIVLWGSVEEDAEVLKSRKDKSIKWHPFRTLHISMESLTFLLET